eukprot:CAMPEP_0174369476 /NCGR_PEP_ID=MMETSP0811_2-20130205/92596_1 /TAXON_ID=73025 ORGANISM="Eutreptiella gymnastica-like, Strain CCMP1594" /NCGR_SAMPLE_ID=MMETSP0811_2 /ASSEMBLY_ACC=CAM_ASM_000667 /LENGTH=69 /DNA_ID=CAMNT_0015513945 /DNA_START=1 /DNA_END=207 /DNA_ORIENTATION=-
MLPLLVMGRTAQSARAIEHDRSSTWNSFDGTAAKEAWAYDAKKQTECQKHNQDRDAHQKTRNNDDGPSD